MSQKELLYLEDIYNHELLIINIISETLNCINDDTYISMFNKQLKKHENLGEKILKLLEEES